MTSVKPRLIVLVDGADMDRGLGEILGRKPQPSERPRWGRVLEFAKNEWPDRDVKGLFWIRNPQRWSDSFNRFTGAINALGFKTVAVKDVQQAIEDFLRGQAHRPHDVILLSHQDHMEALAALVDGRRIVGVVAFPELFENNQAYEDIGIRVLDFEHDIKAFDHTLTARRMYTGEVSDVEALLDGDW